MAEMGVEDPMWDTLNTDTLVDINQYARRLVISEKYGRFYPVQGRWLDTFGPGIPDGR